MSRMPEPLESPLPIRPTLNYEREDYADHLLAAAALRLCLGLPIDPAGPTQTP